MNRESLSALLDGECRGAELDQLLDALDREPSLKAEWSRLCVARSALHRKATVTDEALVRNVMAGIAREPVAAPVPRVPAPSWNWLRPLAGPLTGYALAAIAGAVAVLSLVATQKPDVRPPQSAALAEYQLAANTEPDSRQHSITDAQLNSYLRDYNRNRAGQGMSRSLGYARYAAHDAVYQTTPGGQ